MESLTIDGLDFKQNKPSLFSKISGREGGVIPPIPHDLVGRLMFTTEVSVWPQTFPYADCSGTACGNELA